MGSCDRVEGGVYAEKGKSVSIVKRGKREDEGVHQRAVEKRIYLAIKVTTNDAGILCREKGWEEVDSIRLLIFEQVNNQE